MTMLWKRESAQRLLQFLFNLSSACCCCDVGRAAATLYSQVEQAYRGRCSCAGAEFRNHFGFKYVVPCDGRAGFDLVSWLLRETGWGGITFTDAPSLQRAHAAFAPVGGWSYWCAARAGGCTWSYFRKSAQTLATEILLRLSLKDRLAAGAVSRSWRRAACHPTAWAEADARDNTLKGLLLAAAKAVGQLHKLTVLSPDRCRTTACVHVVLSANKTSLLHIHLVTNASSRDYNYCHREASTTIYEVDTFLRAAPAL